MRSLVSLRRMVSHTAWIGLFGVVVGIAAAAGARKIAPAPAQPGAPGGVVNIPYSANDGAGTNWTVYQNGMFRQQQGNFMVYNQGGMLMVNGANPNAQNNQAKIDEKTGEMVMENMQCNGCTVTRRILFNKTEGGLRVIDIIKNTQGQDLQAQIAIHTQINYGVQSTQNVEDPRAKNQAIGVITQTQVNNQTIAELFAGKGSKVMPTIQSQQGTNEIVANFNYTIPAGKEIAVMHLHSGVSTPELASKWATTMRDARLLSDVSPAIRKILINFRSGVSYVGDVEILRGDLFDVVEMRGGDHYFGTLKPTTYRLKTSYGTIELASQRVIGLINVGEFRPRQLLVTSDGEIFGGELDSKELSIELSNKQMATVPVAQIARMGYRKAANEPEEWVFDKPLVMLRTGERMFVQMPANPIEVVTRFGTLKLKGELLYTIALQSDDSAVHQILLADGSKLSGLVNSREFDMKVTDAKDPVKFATAAISRMQFTGKVPELDDSSATLTLNNEDVLAGSILGQLKLQTAFNTVTLNGGEVKRLTKSKTAVQDVQIEMWDGTTLSGQLEQPEFAVKLVCGLELSLPVALMDEYLQPRPQPSAAVGEAIVKLIGELNADDWAVRDGAQKKLVAFGPVVIGMLKEVRAKQAPEAQQRIDQIVAAVEKAEQKAPPPPVDPNGEAQPAIPEQ